MIHREIRVEASRFKRSLMRHMCQAALQTVVHGTQVFRLAAGRGSVGFAAESRSTQVPT